jgi:hypothetical protein
MNTEPIEIDDDDFNEPLPDRPESCNMDEGCESCQ